MDVNKCKRKVRRVVEVHGGTLVLIGEVHNHPAVRAFVVAWLIGGWAGAMDVTPAVSINVTGAILLPQCSIF